MGTVLLINDNYRGRWLRRLHLLAAINLLLKTGALLERDDLLTRLVPQFQLGNAPPVGKDRVLLAVDHDGQLSPLGQAALDLNSEVSV